MIYVIGENGSTVVKIGYTRDDSTKRMSSLQTGNPQELTVFWSGEGDKALERHLHSTFQPYRVRGEWFDFASLGDPVEAIKEAYASALLNSASPGASSACHQDRPAGETGARNLPDINVQWLQDRQEELFGSALTISDYSALVAALARHQVHMPQLDAGSLDVGSPDAYWRAAALLEQIVLLRPLPARNEYFGYGVAIAYLKASGQTVDPAYEPWRDLITDIRALRLTVYDIADRLRSLRPAE